MNICLKFHFLIVTKAIHLAAKHKKAHIKVKTGHENFVYSFVKCFPLLNLIISNPIFMGEGLNDVEERF